MAIPLYTASPLHHSEDLDRRPTAPALYEPPRPAPEIDCQPRSVRCRRGNDAGLQTHSSLHLRRDPRAWSWLTAGAQSGPRQYASLRGLGGRPHLGNPKHCCGIPQNTGVLLWLLVDGKYPETSRLFRPLGYMQLPNPRERVPRKNPWAYGGLQISQGVLHRLPGGQGNVDTVVSSSSKRSWPCFVQYGDLGSNLEKMFSSGLRRRQISCSNNLKYCCAMPLKMGMAMCS